MNDTASRQQPRVSVILATYNRATMVVDAITSVMQQTYRDFELIIVDDGSTDETPDVVANYLSEATYIRQPNLGRSSARNTGIDVARGEYIAFIDDDDIWYPTKLDQQVAYLDANPEVGLVHTFISVMDKDGNPLLSQTQKLRQLYQQNMKTGYDYAGMIQLCVMFLSTVMARRKIFDDVGIFDPSIPAFEDWDLYLRIALKYRIVTMPECLAHYRLYGSNTPNNELTTGRINTAIKHLSLLNTANEKIAQSYRYYLYVHLAEACYISRDTAGCVHYGSIAFRLSPLRAVRSRLTIHMLISLIPGYPTLLKYLQGA